MMENLTGSEKQIAWATEIRQQRLEQFAAFMKQQQERFDNAKTEGNDRKQERARLTLADCFEHQAAMERIGDASWWIDHRDLSLAQLFGHLNGGVYATWLSSRHNHQMTPSEVLEQTRRVWPNYKGE